MRSNRCHIFQIFYLKMELSEVVSAHFAFPVVGVVLCAVLVFAFGFKSPVQPPSFDLLDDDDDRKYKKFKQKKQKTSIDGNVINIDGHHSPSVKMSVKQQATLNKQTTNEKADIPLVKTKIKKPKSVTEMELASENPAEKEDHGETGEWTKATSKKDRKNRSKKDDNTKKDDVNAMKAERVSPVREIPKAMQTNQKNTEVTVTAPAPALPPALMPGSTVSAVPGAVSVNASSISGKTKTTVVVVTVSTASVTRSEPQKPSTADSEPRVNSASTSIPQPSQKASEKKSVPLNVARLPGEDCAKVVPVSVAVTTCDVTHGETETEEVQKDLAANVTEGDGKPAVRSPKKKKTPESREKYLELPVVTIPKDVMVSSALNVESKAVIKNEKHDVHEEIQTVDATRSAREAETSKSVVQPQPSSPSSDTLNVEKTHPTTADVEMFSDETAADGGHPDHDFQSTPTANDSQLLDAEPKPSDPNDELGDWQQAKPLKKKRKTHREN